MFYQCVTLDIRSRPTTQSTLELLQTEDAVATRNETKRIF